MTQKELIEALIDEMVEYGEAFIGTMEVQGVKAYRLYTKINKEVKEKYPGKVACWNDKTGMAWVG